jgi:hypothetical protein
VGLTILKYIVLVMITLLWSCCSNYGCDRSDITCYIEPTQDWFYVGDHPKFNVSIHNKGKKPIYLVGCLDKSENGGRYPTFTLQIEGPPGGLEWERFARCGNVNNLQKRDFVLLNPGEWMNPFERNLDHMFWSPLSESFARFAKPGRYLVVFNYSTSSRSIDDWKGTSDRVLGFQPEVSTLLKQVPRISLACTTYVTVKTVDDALSN